MMKPFIYTLLFLWYATGNLYASEPMPTPESVAVTATKTQKIPLLIVELKDTEKSLKECCNTVKRDMAFSGQFEPSLQMLAKTNGSEIPSTFLKDWSKDHPFIIALTQEKGYCIVKLYDTEAHKVTTFKNTADQDQVNIGHEVSKELHKLLTSKSSPFGSKIVFCKERKKGKTDICVADYDGQNMKIVTSRSGLAIAPRFNADPAKPTILFSEYEATNCCLKMSDLKGKVQLATNFDGINMQPAFSPDGKDAVLCISAKGNSRIYRSTYNATKKRQEYVCLTPNTGTNISPTFTADGNIAFCSDFRTGSPQIYLMDRKGKNVTCLTNGGMCTCPSYNLYNNKLAFIKIIDGKGQIMSYDFKTGSSTQLTSDDVHKDEVSWSPCGNYLLFIAEEKNKNYLAILNLATKEQKAITDGTFNVSYPFWSTYTIHS